MHRIISGWLILKDGENKGKVALQKRSFTEKHFPYIHQATWSGKIEAGESEDDAMKRECREEMGQDFFNNFDFSKLKILPGGNYVGQVDVKALKLVKLHKDAFPEFNFIGKKDKFYSSKSASDPKNNVVLFDDQHKTLKKILNGDKRNNK